MEEHRIENGGPAGPEEPPMAGRAYVTQIPERRAGDRTGECPAGGYPARACPVAAGGLRPGRWAKLLPVQARAIPYVLAGGM